MLLAFTLGICSYIYIKEIYNIRFSNIINIDFNPLEILSLLITLLIAFYVARILNKKNERERFEISFIINKIINYDEKLKKNIELLLEQQHLNTPKTRADLKYLRQDLNSLINHIKDNKLLKDFTLCDEIKSDLTSIWKSLTDSSSSSLVVSPKQHFTKNFVSESTARKNLTKISSNMFRLIIDLNQNN
jgi:cysteinyl-tRNA synthetase